MALPSKVSVALPVEVVASGGHLVRQVDTSGVALDDPTYTYSVAMPVMPVDSNGVNEDSSRVFSTHLRVTLSSQGLPVVRVDTAGNTINTSLGTGGGSTTPVNTGAPVLSGTPTQGATLSVTNGTWSVAPTGYHYYWTADGVTIVSAADANTYTLTPSEVGKIIQCSVVALNGAATSSPAASNSLGPVTNSGGLPSNTVAPAITGAAVVGQTLYSDPGTWTNSPTFTYQWYKDGVALDGETADTLLLYDIYQGGIIKCNVTATNGSGSANQDSSNTAAVAAIDLTNAITSITRTSASGVTPMTVDIAFGSNVYAGYILDRIVYTDVTLSTYKNGHEYDSIASHVLTNADLQPGATIDWSGDGGPSIAATDWVQFRVRTTSPNAQGYQFTYSPAISPTDAVVPVTWNPLDSAAHNTFSADNLTVYGNAPGDWWVRDTKAVQPGEHKYFELDPSGPYPLGVLTSTFDLTTYGGFGAESPEACVFDANAGVICYGSGHTSVSANGVAGHHVGVDVNYTGSHPVVTFYIDGVAVTPTNNSMTSVTGTVFAGGHPGNGGSILGRFKSADWTQTPPSGATQL